MIKMIYNLKSLMFIPVLPIRTRVPGLLIVIMSTLMMMQIFLLNSGTKAYDNGEISESVKYDNDSS